MKRFWIVFFFASLITQTSAQQVQGPPAPAQPPTVAPVQTVTVPLPFEVQRPTQRAIPYERIMYVLDVSGSMQSALPSAIAVTDAFASDSFKAAVVTFNDSHQRWEGVREPCRHLPTEPHTENCLEPGWSWMPFHRDQMLRHLSSFTGSGGTDPTSALDYAIRHAPTGTLIVFISDGDFVHTDSGPKPGPLTAVKTAMAWREKSKLAPVQILVWATSEQDAARASLVELAKLGGGGLWRADTRRSGPW